MKLETIQQNAAAAVVVTAESPVITDVQSALDLAMTVKYETGCANIAIVKEAVAEDFFVLSTRLAGEILQKYTNYGIRLAVFGDFSKYNSKALRDFIYESNQGKSFYFQPDQAGAIDKLCGPKPAENP
ncbi:MAG: DUF4180 domain-containing protein [Oscillibacter sp.]|nr:DUF4180 domain-containing protein [Oscillibacter sp.]